MRITATALLALLVSVGPVSAKPADQPDYKKVKKLFSGDQTIVGETIHYPQGEPVNIRSLIVTLKPGEATGWHKHGVPTYGYMLSGELSVDYGKKGKRVYRTGEAFMEAMDWWHNGLNETGKPARVLVVFMGAKGHPPVIREGAPKQAPK
jgi:quercetin dioxygenase-like cupin family protein